MEEKGKSIEGQIVRIRNGIVEDITKVVNDKVKADGYDLVFDTSGYSVNNVPVVLYAKDSFDFTKDIVEKLNADRPAGAAAAVTDDKPTAPPAPVNIPKPDPKRKP
jgi:outer membrane protein